MTDEREPLDETTDGPDVVRAHAKAAEVKVQTDEVQVILEESRRLSKGLIQVGRRNHFTDKLRAAIRGAA